MQGSLTAPAKSARDSSTIRRDPVLEEYGRPQEHVHALLKHPNGARSDDATARLQNLLTAAPSRSEDALSVRGDRAAFVPVVQALPPRQRAVLILHDVLDWASALTGEESASTMLGGIAKTKYRTRKIARIRGGTTGRGKSCARQGLPWSRPSTGVRTSAVDSERGCQSKERAKVSPAA